jgi:hypothetical protein
VTAKAVAVLSVPGFLSAHNRLHAAAERHVGDDRVPGLVALVAWGGQVHVEASLMR